MIAHRESETLPVAPATRLSGEDLSFWWLDSPMQPTTMAMLMLLDRVPSERRLREALERAVFAVPRLAQRVVDAPLGVTLPRWELDPTFDLDYHVRRHALPGRHNLHELFREITPAYETPFDRSRPLWEARVYEGLAPGHRAAVFFKLHHAVADGVGGNAVFAAMTDGEREPGAHAPACHALAGKGQWGAPTSLPNRLLDALRDRLELDLERAGALAGSVLHGIQHPEEIKRAAEAVASIVKTLRFDSHSPLRHKAGRSRCLSGIDLPFADMRALKHALGGTMIDVILTIMARAIGRWHAAQGITTVDDLMTLVPVNLRKPNEWTENVNIGNVATGILVALPIRLRGPLATYREVRRRMEERKADPAASLMPSAAAWLSALPRSLVTWMAEASFGNIDYIVTNVPGILVPRFLAGAEITAAYPFAPVAMGSPVSVALYGYRDRLFIGLDSDEALMPDIAKFQEMIHASFDELGRAAGVGRPATPKHRAALRRPAH
jgi:WS/DGAT/MGAT family acyltransferase